MTKIERMRRQAMDISMKSSLLSRQSHKIYIPMAISAAEFFQGKYDDEELYRCMLEYAKEIGDEGMAPEEKLRILCNKEKIAVREKGYGNVFLSIGELIWKRSDEKAENHAPMYLCPVEIYRNKRGEYFFSVNRNGCKFNPVLKEMLLQDYSIDVQDLKDSPLGDEYKKQMELLRYLVGRQPEWSIEENIANIAEHTLPNEAIKNGLYDSAILEHEIVKGILNGIMDWDNELEAEDDKDETGVYVYPADSSQDDVIRFASRKKAQVVIGPAGNGKTQTIANCMLQELYRGGKVLFVSEKLSAIDVLHGMLKKAGAAPFCIEITGENQKPEKISGKIEDTLRFLEYYEELPEEYEKDICKFRETEKALESFYSAMKSKGCCGKSMTELIEMREKYGKVNVNLNYQQVGDALNKEDSEDIMERFAKVCERRGRMGMKYRDFLRWDNSQTAQQHEDEIIVNTALDKLENLKAQAERLGSRFGILEEDMPLKKKIQYMVAYASLLEQCPVIGGRLSEFLAYDPKDSEKQVRGELLQLLHEMQNADTRSRKYKMAAEQLSERMELTGVEYGSIFIMKKPNYKALADRIRSADVHFLDNSEEEMVRRKEWPSEKIQKYKECLKAAERFNSDIKSRISLEEVLEETAKGNGGAEKTIASDVLDAYRDYSRARKSAEQRVLRNIDIFEAEYPEKMTAELFEEWKVIQHSQQSVRAYEKVVQSAEDEGLGFLVKQMEEKLAAGVMKAEEIMPAFYKCWCDYNIACIRNTHKELQDISSLDYEILMDNYIKREKRIRRQLKKNMVYRQVSRLPRAEEGIKNAPEFGRLNTLIRRKYTTVRSFFEQAPNALSALYPCMLMSPDAVAEYIPSDFPAFDMVIIDEGSQMLTYKALIPISRGRRCMIFGDERQLTPTSFFKKKLSEDDGYLTAMESILCDAIITSMPRKMLRYHYRSESESLIAFSNVHYYANEIITFPSCSSRIFGVEYQYIEDGCYDRGGKKINFEEANAVIQKIQDIYCTLPDDTEETVGIITLNTAQKDLIQSLLLKKSITDDIMGRRADELISVVNLEACQGKEWDYVIISPGYGPDKDGVFTANLGAMSRENGENRLNVMLTRSRKKMFVVTSLKPEMLSGDRSQGTVDFKEFLAYARGDICYDTRQSDESRGNVSGISQTVARELRKHGYEVHFNIGSSRCKVDIGILSKKYPEKYGMGILLDHFSEPGYSVKDRELICPTVLERKGWNIYRLHSINWYEDAGQEMEEILRRLEEIEGGEENV